MPNCHPQGLSIPQSKNDSLRASMFSDLAEFRFAWGLKIRRKHSRGEFLRLFQISVEPRLKDFLPVRDERATVVHWRWVAVYRQRTLHPELSADHSKYYSFRYSRCTAKEDTCCQRSEKFPRLAPSLVVTPPYLTRIIGRRFNPARYSLQFIGLSEGNQAAK